MEYLPLLISLTIASACAIAAYELLDLIERDEYEGLSRWSGTARVTALDTLPFASVSLPRPPGPREDPSSIERSSSDVRPDSDRLDVRICGLEARLEGLERECDRIEASRFRSQHVA